MRGETVFQSTLPGWGATPGSRAWQIPIPHFNPRSPDGERLSQSTPLPHGRIFQSTLPGWGATPAPSRPAPTPRYFNPRSPDGERHGPVRGVTPTPNFNPRSPDGERRGPIEYVFHLLVISIHAPRMGSDTKMEAGGVYADISIHAPRMGSDRENGHLRPRYGQNHPFSTLIVSQIVVDVLGTVRKSQKTPAH